MNKGITKLIHDAKNTYPESYITLEQQQWKESIPKPQVKIKKTATNLSIKKRFFSNGDSIYQYPVTPMAKISSKSCTINRKKKGYKLKKNCIC